jgi:hypothetical protein
MTRSFVGIVVNGVLETHLPPASQNYATLCGMDGDDNDPGVDQHHAEPGAKVDCIHCRAIFDRCSQFRTSDFKRQIV